MSILPPELLRLVVESADVPTQLAIVRVSKSAQVFALEQLYHSVAFESDGKLRRFRDAGAAAKHGQRIRQLYVGYDTFQTLETVGGGEDEEPTEEYYLQVGDDVRFVVAQCVYLEVLVIDILGCHRSNVFCPPSLELPSSLEHLHFTDRISLEMLSSIPLLRSFSYLEDEIYTDWSENFPQITSLALPDTLLILEDDVGIYLDKLNTVYPSLKKVEVVVASASSDLVGECGSLIDSVLKGFERIAGNRHEELDVRITFPTDISQTGTLERTLLEKNSPLRKGLKLSVIADPQRRLPQINLDDFTQ